jgi:protein involved in polysaccharide export with SLBB domain
MYNLFKEGHSFLMLKKFIFTGIILISSVFNLNVQAQKLNPGDGVRITFLDITDPISGDYYIQPDGKLQLPYAGIFDTNNKEFPEIRSEIFVRYDSLYRNPDLTISALYRINIHGEVRNPGFYYVTETERLTGIIALAGGYTNAANLDDMYIFRENEEIELDVKQIIARGNTAADIGLKSGDQIVIPRSFWSDPGRFTWVFSLIGLVVTAIALFLR